MPLTPIRTALTLIGGVLATLIGAPLVLIITRFKPDSPLIERIISWWARVWLICSGTRLEVQGTEHIDRSKSYVVVANHLSALDIMVCFTAIPLPIRYLAKKELFRIPLLAPAMRAVGIVEVDRAARGAALESINRQIEQVVARGHSLIVYPEGTRSRTGRLKTFKKGAFTIAAANRMPVVPVTIWGTFHAWPPGSLIVRGGRVRVVIDPPLPVTDAETMRMEAERIVSRRLAELQTGS